MTWEIRVGDCRELLRAMPEQSAQTCVTSPPYFGLRDYGHDGQIGLEPTPAEFVTAMVETFREVRRVLRDDGTVWLNLGDTYNAYHGNAGRIGESGIDSRPDAMRRMAPSGSGLMVRDLKQKDLIGVPWMVAFALREDGWYLRSDIIWAKPNPMPESVTDRPTKAHEYVFLLSKQPRYYYDAAAIREEWAAPDRREGVRLDTPGLPNRGLDLANSEGRNIGVVGDSAAGRNKRSVWTVTTQPYSGAHFATFPPKLIEPCILAGAPEGGTVLDPFAGAGTTGVVALRRNRSFIGCELNPTYAEMARQRIRDDGPLFNVGSEIAA